MRGEGEGEASDLESRDFDLHRLFEVADGISSGWLWRGKEEVGA